MRDSNLDLTQEESKQFERCHGGGRAYEAYKKIEPKFTEEFKLLMFEVLVETYVRNQMDSKIMTDRDFVNTKNIFRAVAEELGILKTYPYIQDGFPQAHPMAKAAAREGKKRLGIG